MPHSLVLIALVTAICGVPFGLLLRSNTEASRGSPEPRLFVLDGLLGLLATIVEKTLVVMTLFFVPSLALLWLMQEMPAAGAEMRVWWIANMAGIGLGKWIRWRRWRRKQNFY